MDLSHDAVTRATGEATSTGGASDWLKTVKVAGGFNQVSVSPAATPNNLMSCDYARSAVEGEAGTGLWGSGVCDEMNSRPRPA
jgi:hypothetical protein